MYSLYSRPGAGSAAVEALLAVCEVPYRTIDLERAPDGTFWIGEETLAIEISAQKETGPDYRPSPVDDLEFALSI